MVLKCCGKLSLKSASFPGSALKRSALAPIACHGMGGTWYAIHPPDFGYPASRPQQLFVGRQPCDCAPCRIASNTGRTTVGIRLTLHPAHPPTRPLRQAPPPGAESTSLDGESVVLPFAPMPMYAKVEDNLPEKEREGNQSANATHSLTRCNQASVVSRHTQTTQL